MADESFDFGKQPARPSEREEPKEQPKPPAPAWGWFFAVACGIIPVLTLGGAIPAMIGIGGASGCLGIAASPTMSVPARVAACVAVTVACWVSVILLIGGLALLMQ
jgi:hypothetical protein